MVALWLLVWYSIVIEYGGILIDVVFMTHDRDTIFFIADLA